jgi:RNA polymerase sigma factor (sigma-70 family)
VAVAFLDPLHQVKAGSGLEGDVDHGHYSQGIQGLKNCTPSGLCSQMLTTYLPSATAPQAYQPTAAAPTATGPMASAPTATPPTASPPTATTARLSPPNPSRPALTPPDLSLDELFADARALAPEAGIAGMDDLRQVLDLLAKMDQREAAVLRMRYGLDDEEPKTLKEIGERLGLTRERVRQIEVEALGKLRAQLEAA